MRKINTELIGALRKGQVLFKVTRIISINVNNNKSTNMNSVDATINMRLPKTVCIV